MTTSPKKVTHTFNIIVIGKNLAVICHETLKKNRGIRVVGRLSQSTSFDESGNAVVTVEIVAEHVEFKPVTTKPDKDVTVEVEPDSAHVEA